MLLFAYVAGWMTPDRLTPARFVDQFQHGGVHPGFRRNHAKGMCVSGYFQSNGAASRYSTASVFATDARTPVIGRFAVPGPNPVASDAAGPVRSLALRFTPEDGQQWRTAMNNSPVFVVATPAGFLARMIAHQPDPATGKPDPARIAAFRAAHPETRAFLAWAKATRPSSSWATQTYRSLDAFEFVDAEGHQHPVRWRMQSETPAPINDEGSGNDGLATDLQQRLAQGPLRWRLIVTLAQPGDPTDDATRAWPEDRPEVDAGTLVLTRAESQSEGPCRDINYDPTVLPNGIRISNDPLLPARSAVYALSHLRRTSEEAHVPGYPAVQPSATPQEHTP
ncbi:catalase family peroxidase [Oleiagrimonas soli]|uniref:Catalase-related peroxidase n=1 Tax=Oleiagrimonas soli TaxID=1543381 RepID=A0A841KHK2_9GAMM|nr:catalase [Oleiagrimonas soli]